jgi:hypothetical protein
MCGCLRSRLTGCVLEATLYTQRKSEQQRSLRGDVLRRHKEPTRFSHAQLQIGLARNKIVMHVLMDTETCVSVRILTYQFFCNHSTFHILYTIK